MDLAEITDFIALDNHMPNGQISGRDFGPAHMEAMSSSSPSMQVGYALSVFCMGRVIST